jgi:hypothetical protein
VLLSKDRLTVVEKFICPDEKRVWAERVRLPCSIEEIEEPVVTDTGARSPSVEGDEHTQHAPEDEH